MNSTWCKKINPSTRHLSSPFVIQTGVLLLFGIALSFSAFAHDVASADKAFVMATEGQAIIPFMYLGAKHMVTGYDHVLFLIGVVFYLSRLRDVVTYVSLFTLGHSTTLILGVLMETGANSYLVDAVIGLSVVYKAVDNLSGGLRFDARLAVLLFGFVHGLGLATKLLDLSLSEDGRLNNLLAFNAGVEVGQVLILFFVVTLINRVRQTNAFVSTGKWVNRFLVLAGVTLTGYQVTLWAAV